MTLKKLALVFFAAALIPLAFPQPPDKGVISGTVIDAESGDPVRKAVVTLTLQGTPRRWATIRTDGSGHFQFDGLPPGKYEMRAIKGSQGSAIYGANHVHELGGLLTLAGGEIRAVTLRFLHSASISGHVYDSEGDPLTGAAVNLMRKGRNLGAPVLVNYRGATTNDSGEYRIPNIDPGQYYLHATPEQNQRFADPSFQPKFILVDQYYGGARDSNDASPLHVSGGEQLTGMDFRLSSEPVVQLQGHVAGLPPAPDDAAQLPAAPGVPMYQRGRFSGPGVQVLISPAEAGPSRWTRNIPVQPPDYHFQFPDMPSGRYRLEANAHLDGKTYNATKILDLRSGSSDIELSLAPAVDIHGRLRVEEGSARIDDAPALQRVVQLVRPGTMQGVLSAQVGADGRFTLSAVPAGEWQLAVNPVPPGFLKSARLGDKDIRFTMFEIGPDTDAQLNVVVSMNTGTVQGEVDAASSQAKRSGIVLAPVGPFHHLARFYYGVTADDEGKFRLAGIAPGTYKIFALENLAPQNFRNPEAAEQLDELGEPIEVKEGATVAAHPRLIPYDRASEAAQ